MVTLRDASDRPIPKGRVTFHPFTVRREGDAFLVGSKLGRFIEVDARGLRVIEVLQEGVPWEDVGARLQAETGRAFDIDAFLRRLAPHGLLHTVGPLVVWSGEADARATRAPRAIHRAARHPVALALAAGLGAIGVALAATNPRDVGRPGEVLFSDDPLFTLLLLTALGWALTLAHEGAHYASARGYGIDATLRLGTRLHFLVCETDVTNAWSLPRRARAVILGSGLALNLAVLGLTEVALHALTLSDPARFVLRQLNLVNAMQFVFQGLFFLRTDAYYLIVALTSERNLRARSFRALASTFSRGTRCPACGGHERAGECPLCSGGRRAGAARRRALAGYALVTVAGSATLVAGALVALALYTTPFLGHLVSLIAESSQSGEWRSGGEAAVLLAAIAAQLVLIAVLTGRKLEARARREVHQVL